MRKLYLIIIAIVVVLVISTICVVAIINNNKSQDVSAETIENEEEVMANEQENIEEYIDINELTENTLVTEETNTASGNATKNNSTGGKPYYIKVNYGAQVVTIYKQDSDGNYTVPVKAMVCSTGKATPKAGVYSIPGKWNWGGLQGNVYGQYCTHITGNILFHSVPYLQKGNPASLEYWEYDKLGTAASAGCVRLTVADAQWIFNNCPVGTRVEFYSSSDPGPLGKPTARKISNAGEPYRNWDPTDPNANNPWKNYEPENSDTNESVNTVTSTNTQVNETVNTNTETNVNTQVNEDIKTNTETNVNTQVNESVNTNTDTDTNTKVNEQVNTNTEIKVNVETSVNEETP